MRDGDSSRKRVDCTSPTLRRRSVLGPTILKREYIRPTAFGSPFSLRPPAIRLRGVHCSLLAREEADLSTRVGPFTHPQAAPSAPSLHDTAARGARPWAFTSCGLSVLTCCPCRRADGREHGRVAAPEGAIDVRTLSTAAQPTSRGSIDVYGSRSVHCARKRCHTPASIAITIDGRRRRLERLPWSRGTRQSIAVDAIVRVQPFKAMAARSWANESGTLLFLTRRRLKRRAVNRCVSGASSTAAQCAPQRSVEPTAAMETSPRRSAPPK